MITIQINPIHITDSMLDSMASGEVLNLLKSILNEIRKETISNAPEANMAALEKPNNSTKKKKQKTKAKVECPYHGINYAPSSNSFYCRINQIVVVKRVDPVFVAMVRDLYMDGLESDVPRNYDEFDEVKKMLESLTKEELSDIEMKVKSKLPTLG